MNNTTKLFRVSKDGVAGDFYFASSSKPPAVVFLQGMPGSMKKNDAGDFLASQGHSLLNLEYPGTFNNGGDLTPENCVQGAVNAVQLLQSGNVADAFSGDEFSVSPEVVLAGTSLGGVVALSAMAQLKGVTKLLLFSPAFLFSKNAKESGLTEDLSGLLNYMKRCLPYTHRLADEEGWRSLFEGVHPYFQALKWLESLNGKNILVVRGVKDTSILETASTHFQELVKANNVPCDINVLTVEEGGHDYRTLLTSDVKDKILAFLSGEK